MAGLVRNQSVTHSPLIRRFVLMLSHGSIGLASPLHSFGRSRSLYSDGFTYFCLEAKEFRDISVIWDIVLVQWLCRPRLTCFPVPGAVPA